MKILKTLIILGLFVIAGTAVAGTLLLKSQEPATSNHGTHLCTQDDDCGVSHKCCDGHCMMVDTCG
ncbi:MAG: hypothetical protein HQM16_02280 [Deltaproteobacteria bacterium]|nr:hypothetical protein [Deltaproteobacteria bacterium]